MSTTPNKPSSPWHAGELAMQTQVGVVARMDEIGRRVLRNYLIEQHRQFYPQLPFVVLGSVDSAGDAWATVRSGVPGFLHSPEPSHLHVALPRDTADPADAGMDDGCAIGLLGIELHTRRRNRLNGTIRRDKTGFDIVARQSYGNCPQYIRLRDFRFARDPSVPTEVPAIRRAALDDDARRMIAGADTFFVASSVERDGVREVDVSHRGGKPGFVRVDGEGVLTIPDFAGNNFFNTLGNILSNPRTGLVFVDFATGDLLQLTGDAEVVVDSPEIAAFQGAERLWRFRPRAVVRRPDAFAVRWIDEKDGESPNSLMTGDWNDAGTRLDAAQLAQTWRPFRIAGIVDEAAMVRSLQLEPADGAGLVAALPGQHLPVRLRPQAGVPVVRTYTLSNAASDAGYRISVKREGLASSYLHSLAVGDVIEVRAPAGAFTLDAGERRPAVLIAAGIGITPMLAMLRQIVHEGRRLRRTRRTWLFYAARNRAERAFEAEIAALAAQVPEAIRVVRVLSDVADAAAGDYDAAGRIDLGLLQRWLPLDDYDFYLCGPPAFMQSLYGGLRALNLADTRIHAEAFGPASLRRDGAVPTEPAASEPTTVGFTRTKTTAVWRPGSGTLLSLAEAQGLAPESSCRGGSCGTCRTRIVEGRVAYATKPAFPVAGDEALICCAVPAATAGQKLSLDL